MDFETHPISRDDIRIFANLIRKNYRIKTIKFPVLEFLENIESLTNNEVDYIVEEDTLFEKKVMSYIQVNNIDYSSFTIHIRESVYKNAYNGKHADIGYIMHEISHYFMIGVFGFRPQQEICYSSKKIPLFRSAEWQAMALCGELMIPYEKCMMKTAKQIYHITKSSKAQVNYFEEINWFLLFSNLEYFKKEQVAARSFSG